MKSSIYRALGPVFLTALCATAPLTMAQTSPMPATADAGQAEGPGMLVSAWRSATDTEAWLGPGIWRLGFSPFSQHFRPSDEHRNVWALGIERVRPDDWLAGASYFRNSFGQPSAYVYFGKRFPALLGYPPLYAQASVGMLYGYRGQYKDKVPLNVNGFSPGALVGLGWQFSPRLSFTAHMLGDAALMLQLSFDLR